MLSFGSAIAILLCLTSAQKPRQEGESFNLTTHSNLTLHPRHRGMSRQEWRLGRDVKIAIWEKGIGYNYPKGPFQGRVTINETSITLIDLRPNDSATLTYFSEDSSGTESEYPYAISVRGEPFPTFAPFCPSSTLADTQYTFSDPLRPPILRLMTNNSRPRTESRISLQCIALDNDSSITYAWYTDTLESGDNIQQVTVRTDPEVAVTCRISDGHSTNSATLVVPLNRGQ